VVGAIASLVAAIACFLGIALASPAQAQTSQDVKGTVRQSGEGVVGVRFIVTRGDEAIGESTTDEDGRWQVELPEPGTYTVTLDLTTLPEGVALREDDEPVREVEVSAGQSKGVLFALERESGGGSSTVKKLANLFVDGIKVGAIIAITSVGLSLIFGVTGLVNFAHGELVTFGAVVAFYLNGSSGNRIMPLFVAAIIAMIAGGVLGGALELGIFSRLRRRRTSRVSLLVTTIGLGLLLRHIILIVYGEQGRKYLDYAIQTDPVEFGPISIPPRDLIVIIISLAVLAAVGLLLQRTRLGTAMRAVADDRDLASSSGINVGRVTLAVWIAGGALAALGGVFYGLTSFAVSWDMGLGLLLLMFAGIIVGGLGTAFGAMVGGLFVGIASEMSTEWLSPEFKYVVAFLTLILVLLVRPQGILGRRERIG